MLPNEMSTQDEVLGQCKH